MSKLIFSDWQPMNVIKTGARASYNVMTRMLGGANALFEGLVGAPAPGKQTLTVMPHDHTSYAGGLTLHRGLVGGFDYGEAPASHFYRTIAGGEINTKVRFLNEVASGEDNFRGEQDFYVFVSPGHSGSATNRSSGFCSLVGDFVVYNNNLSVGSGGTATLYLRNVDTGDEVSFTTALIASSENIERKTLNNIPINEGGGWSRFAWYIDSPNASTFQINSCLLFETLERTQPVSTGNFEYHNAGSRP